MKKNIILQIITAIIIAFSFASCEKEDPWTVFYQNNETVVCDFISYGLDSTSYIEITDSIINVGIGCTEKYEEVTMHYPTIYTKGDNKFKVEFGSFEFTNDTEFKRAYIDCSDRSFGHFETECQVEDLKQEMISYLEQRRDVFCDYSLYERIYDKYIEIVEEIEF